MRFIISIVIRSVVVAFLIFIALAVSFGFEDAAEPSPLSFVLIFALLLSPLFGWLWAKAAQKKQKQKRDNEAAKAETQSQQKEQDRRTLLRSRFIERQRLIDSVDRHRSALTRNLDRSIKKNDCGVVVGDTSDGALDEFFASIDLRNDLLDFDEAKSVVVEQLEWRRTESTAKGFDDQNLPFDGYEFERWVAESLEGFGWSAEVTRGGGDQGIDVIARKNGKSIGLQCKLYSSSVGNKAVQEAHSGKPFYDLDAVGVLTNADFTKSAKELAIVTGVLLLSHRDIPDLEEKIRDLG